MKALFKEKKYFVNSKEHLYAELMLIELMIKKQILMINEKNKKYYKFDEFSGMYISEEEINSYIAESEGIERYRKRHENGADDSIRSIEDKIINSRNHIDTLINSSVKKGVNLRLLQLIEIFALSQKDIQILLCCLAPDIDVRFERYFAYLQNDMSKKRPTVQLLGRLFFEDERGPCLIREHLSEKAQLIINCLLIFNTNRVSEEVPYPVKQPRLARSIIDFLFEINHLDISLKGLAEIVSPQMMETDSWYFKHHLNILEQIINNYNINKSIPLLYISASKGSGKNALIDSIAYILNKNVLRIKTPNLIEFEGNLSYQIDIIKRESLLHSCIIHLADMDNLVQESNKNKIETVNSFLRERSGYIITSGTKPYEEIKHTLGPVPVHFHIPLPTIEERIDLWKKILMCSYNQEEEDLINELSVKFRFTPGQISSVVDLALISLGGTNNNHKNLKSVDLYKFCKEESNQGLLSYSQKVQLKSTWEDIVLPLDILNQLREISNCVRNRKLVYTDWGFESKFTLGKGLNILFSGPPGTGKTLSAEILANDLCLDLYKIDLSCVVSKYIGETEKNLSRIFMEAQISNCILFFDEADALFGKRTEVKDSHDRYANIEISFLLQRIEEYEGIVILATNLMKNLDSAFVRRLNYVVEFPFPDERYRKLIWNKVFPHKTPKSDDLDFGFLSRKFKIAGGNIKNIALNSAFLAARDGGIVNMDNVILAIKREYQKMGKLCSKSDFGQYYSFIKDEDSL